MGSATWRSRRRRLPARRSSISKRGIMSETPAGLDRLLSDRARCGVGGALVPLGVRTVQLRFKDAPAARSAPRRSARALPSPRYGCQLIVNDYWREAIDAGADCVHLGQEDLAARRRGGHQGGGRAARHLHAQRGRAGRPRSLPARLRCAGPDLGNQAQSHEMGAARAGAHRAMEGAYRRSAACRHRRHHAGARRRRASRRGRNRLPSSPIL